MRFLLIGFLFLGSALTARAQPTPKLHVAVVEQESFIAVGGDKEGAAGLYRHTADTSWVHLGWGNTRNFGLDAVSSEPGTIFLACGNGVLRTLDNSGSWTVTTGWEITEVLDVAIDPSAPTHVYAATAYGVWRSPDQGETWTEVNRGIPAPTSTFTQTIAADRRQAGHLVVGSEEGLYRTTSGGTHWRPVGPRDVAIRDVVQSAAQPRQWLAGTEEDGVLRSRDGGKTWSFVGADVGMETVYAVAFDPSNEDRVAAAGFEGGVFVSDDGGETWTPAGLADRRIHALAFDVEQTGRLWAGTLGDGVFYQDATGEDWQYGGLDGAVIWGMKFFDTPSTDDARTDDD
jgi:photosystem II stability/assembly factor-like uncharacterized protein